MKIEIIEKNLNPVGKHSYLLGGGIILKYTSALATCRCRDSWSTGWALIHSPKVRSRTTVPTTAPVACVQVISATLAQILVPRHQSEIWVNLVNIVLFKYVGSRIVLHDLSDVSIYHRSELWASLLSISLVICLRLLLSRASVIERQMVPFEHGGRG